MVWVPDYYLGDTRYYQGIYPVKALPSIKKPECKNIYPKYCNTARIRPYEALSDSANWKKGDLILLPSFFVFSTQSRKTKAKKIE